MWDARILRRMAHRAGPTAHSPGGRPAGARKPRGYALRLSDDGGTTRRRTEPQSADSALPLLFAPISPASKAKRTISGRLVRPRLVLAWARWPSTGLVSCHTVICRNDCGRFLAVHFGKEVGMKRYLVELEAEEREALEAITRKGSHRSQKVVNALVLLNCDRGEFNERRATGREIAGVLRISARRVDRVKKRFVEDGLEAALGNRQAVVRSTFGRRTASSRRASSRSAAAIRPRGARSGRCGCWRTARWSSATSTACLTRRCGAC